MFSVRVSSLALLASALTTLAAGCGGGGSTTGTTGTAGSGGSGGGGGTGGVATTTGTGATAGAGGTVGSGGTAGAGGTGGTAGSGGTGGAGGTGGTTTGSGESGGMGGAGGRMTTSGTGGTGGGFLPCAAVMDCPAPANECVLADCTDGKCTTSFVAEGTFTAAQVAGDCRVDRCNGAGFIVSAADALDLPVDGILCTDDVCTAEVPSNPPLMAGVSCGQDMLCDGNGACVGCLTAMDCPGEDGPCQSRTCTGGTCGVALVAAGTAVGNQAAGDCKVSQCDGAGALVVVNDGADLPVDGNACTGDVCTAGAPSNPALMAGAACNQNGGSACNGAGACLATFVVVRVNDGALALSAAATPVFLEQRLITGALLVKPNNPLPLPTAVNGNHRILTLGGNAASEGNLSLSGNGSYLALAGYDAAVGTASVSTTTSQTVNRVVGRIDAAFAIDTTTRLDSAFNASNVRGATTVDGSGFWVTGNGGGGSGGIHYAVLGVTGSNQILTIPNNTRFAHVQDGELYATGSVTPYLSIFSIGVGAPNMAGQTATLFPGMPNTTPSPYSFAIFDRDPNVPGVDTLYLADDRAILSGGGIQKWTFDGVNWILATTFTSGITAGVRGLAATVIGNTVTVIATTTTNRVVTYVDTNVLSPTGTVVATAALNTAYRGIAFSPK